jgi:NTP pyrophosphatase (non-canonical NTP hydrolase)
MTISHKRSRESKPIPSEQRYLYKIQCQTVDKFAHAMKIELANNIEKGHWGRCDVIWLLGRLEDEVKELKRAIGEGKSVDDVVSEAADVANFAM